MTELNHYQSDERYETAALLEYLEGTAENEKQGDDHYHIGAVTAEDKSLEGCEDPTVERKSACILLFCKLCVHELAAFVNDDLILQIRIFGVFVEGLTLLRFVIGIDGVAACRNHIGENAYEDKHRKKYCNDGDKALQTEFHFYVKLIGFTHKLFLRYTQVLSYS